MNLDDTLVGEEKNSKSGIKRLMALAISAAALAVGVGYCNSTKPPSAPLQNAATYTIPYGPIETFFNREQKEFTIFGTKYTLSAYGTPLDFLGNDFDFSRPVLKIQSDSFNQVQGFVRKDSRLKLEKLEVTVNDVYSTSSGSGFIEVTLDGRK